MGTQTVRFRDNARRDVARSASQDWWLVPEPLVARIAHLRHCDGHRAWSYESIGARVGRTGAAIGKICRGETRQPDIAVVDALADLLGLHRNLFTAGRVPHSVATILAVSADDGLDWLGEPLLAALDRVSDPSAQAVIDNAIRTYLAHATPPQPPQPTAWRFDAGRLNAAIAQAAISRGRTVSNLALAAAVGVGESAIRKLRQGAVTRPALSTLERLAEYLEVPVDELTDCTAPAISRRAERNSPPRCLWLSHENRMNLAALTDPAARATVERGIRLMVETSEITRSRR